MFKYIYAGSKPVAVYAISSAGNTLSYALSDHQGSVSDLTNSSGTSIVNESFTPFGQRRNPTTWSGAASNSDLTTAAGITRQGYTFQTQLGLWMGMNHLNGRVQDAVTGRFLSADPNIPDPTDAQSYNRFSYVNNNPLTLVDPSGFDGCGNDDKDCLPNNPDADPNNGMDDDGNSDDPTLTFDANANASIPSQWVQTCVSSGGGTSCGWFWWQGDYPPTDYYNFTGGLASPSGANYVGGGGGGGQQQQKPPAKSQPTQPQTNQTTTCVGQGKTTGNLNNGVPGALPGLLVQQGNIAIDPAVLGLLAGASANQALAQYGSQITVTFSPQPTLPAGFPSTFTVGDVVGPASARGNSPPIFDINGLPNLQAAYNVTGISQVTVTFPSSAPFTCGAGFQQAN